MSFIPSIILVKRRRKSHKPTGCNFTGLWGKMPHKDKKAHQPQMLAQTDGQIDTFNVTYLLCRTLYNRNAHVLIEGSRRALYIMMT
jgi:hypothetical protein